MRVPLPLPPAVRLLTLLALLLTLLALLLAAPAFATSPLHLASRVRYRQRRHPRWWIPVRSRRKSRPTQ